MKKKILSALISLLCLSACATDEPSALPAPSATIAEATPTAEPTAVPTATPTPKPTATPTPTPSPTPAPNRPDIPQRGMTEALPEEYLLPASLQGTVERITYPSWDFAGEGEPIEKVANVYLPAGYDPEDQETRYDIFYFMHGFTGNADEFFTYNDGFEKNLFDNMIEKGDIPPMIIVAATFDAQNDFADFDRSVEEVRAFHYDFRKYLMPAVESHYHTYSLSTSDEDLAASRDHRAFGGFSLGSVTTWLELCHDPDYIRYYLPISAACWYYGDIGDPQPVLNTDFIASVIEEHALNDKGYFVYACTGTMDSMHGEMDLLMDEMFSRGDAFPPEHMVFYYCEGAAHELVALPVYFYNALPLFFGD